MNGTLVLKRTERVLAILAALYLLRKVLTTGPRALLSGLVGGAVRFVPGARAALDSQLEAEAQKTISDIFDRKPGSETVRRAIPAQGEDAEAILTEMRALQKRVDVDASEGKVFALVYLNDRNEGFLKFIEEVANTFMHENALNPTAFPTLRKYENEAVRMVATLLHGGEDVRGNMTTGGTESILMAMKTWREHGRKVLGVQGVPEVVMPSTAHPAFEKAAHYFGMKCVRIPVNSEYRADVPAMAKAITRQTVLLVGSATQYPHGIVDPIEDIARLAKSRGLPVHVDGCIGGMMLPFVARLGYPVPRWDFEVDGVCSISCDLHKYGYAPKGASVILFSSQKYRKYMFFAFSNWAGGMYISPTMTGTRGGASIAAAWAALVHLGEDGLLELARGIMETSKYLQAEIPKIEGLYIVGKPHMTIVAFASSDPRVNVFAVADVMEDEYGYTLDRQTMPDCIHFTLMPTSAKTREVLVKDIARAVDVVRADPSKFSQKGSAATYGMVAKIPSRDIVDDFLLSLVGKIYE